MGVLEEAGGVGGDVEWVGKFGAFSLCLFFSSTRGTLRLRLNLFGGG